jgi:hypothetical protein
MIKDQKFDFSPPEMKRGCEAFIDESEDAITALLLGQTGDSIPP